MNARIIKETRSVLPVFCVMVLACIAPRLIWSRETAGGVGLAIFTICSLVLGASCFGNEYQWRTMPLLLAQPVPRRKIWNEKMLVLGTALGLGLVLFLLFVPLPESDNYLFLILVPFGVLCTAPYVALNMKNTLLAAACTFGLPFGLCGSLALLWWLFGPLVLHLLMPAGHLLGSYLRQHSPATGSFLEHALDDHPYFWIGIAAAIYCVASYRLGYRTFIKLEAIDVQAKEITLPAGLEAALARPLNRLLPRYGGPWTSLLRKELQIQKAAFVLAGVMCLVSVLMALAWDVDHQELLTGMAAAPIAVLVFVIPMIVPGGSVSEERSWGVSDWQRALPVRARKQWTAKMMVVVFTGVLLGVVLPLMLWISDGWVFQLPIGPGPLHFDRVLTLPPPPDFLRGLLVASDFVLGYMLLLGFGVFTSSLCANSAKAVIMNIGLIIANGSLAAGIISVIWRGSSYEGLADYDPRTHSVGLMVLAVLFVILVGLVQYLACSNYRNGEPSPRRAWMQSCMVVGSIVAGVVVFANLPDWSWAYPSIR